MARQRLDRAPHGEELLGQLLEGDVSRDDAAAIQPDNALASQLQTVITTLRQLNGTVDDEPLLRSLDHAAAHVETALRRAKRLAPERS